MKDLDSILDAFKEKHGIEKLKPSKLTHFECNPTSHEGPGSLEPRFVDLDKKNVHYMEVADDPVVRRQALIKFLVNNGLTYNHHDEGLDLFMPSGPWGPQGTAIGWTIALFVKSVKMLSNFGTDPTHPVYKIKAKDLLGMTREEIEELDACKDEALALQLIADVGKEEEEDVEKFSDEMEALLDKITPKKMISIKGSGGKKVAALPMRRGDGICVNCNEAKSLPHRNLCEKCILENEKHFAHMTTLD